MPNPLITWEKIASFSPSSRAGGILSRWAPLDETGSYYVSWLRLGLCFFITGRKDGGPPVTSQCPVFGLFSLTSQCKVQRWHSEELVVRHGATTLVSVRGFCSFCISFIGQDNQKPEWFTTPLIITSFGNFGAFRLIFFLKDYLST